MNIITPLFSVLYSPARSGHYSPTFAWLKIEMVEQETPIGQYRSQMPLCTDTSLAKLLLCNGGTCTNITVITVINSAYVLFLSTTFVVY